MGDRSGQSADRGKLLFREQLLTGALEFLEIAHEPGLARAKIVDQKPHQHSYHAVNYRHCACFDVLTEFHAIGAQETDEVRQRYHCDRGAKTKPERRFEYGKKHQGVVRSISSDGQRSEHQRQR